MVWVGKPTNEHHEVGVVAPCRGSRCVAISGLGVVFALAHELARRRRHRQPAAQPLPPPPSAPIRRAVHLKTKGESALLRCARARARRRSAVPCALRAPPAPHMCACVFRACAGAGGRPRCKSNATCTRTRVSMSSVK